MYGDISRSPQPFARLERLLGFLLYGTREHAEEAELPTSNRPVAPTT